MTQKLLFGFIGITALFLIQETRVFEIFHIVPNLILVMIAYMFFSKIPRWMIAVWMMYTLGLSFVWTPFWVLPFFALAGFAAVLFFAKEKLTGNQFFDFLLAIVFGTLFFYGALYIQNFPELSFNRLAFEILYNVLAGVLVWIFAYRTNFMRGGSIRRLQRTV